MKIVKRIKRPQIYRANSFVARGCAGNPAGVCLLPAASDDEFYRKVAIKMGVSETAFIFEEGGIYSLRWFTRTGYEVSLCGHATLASAYILFSKGYVDASTTLKFSTKSGILEAKKEGAFIILDFPRKDVQEIKNTSPDLTNALGVTPLFYGLAGHQNLALLDSETTVKNLSPDFEKMKKIVGHGVIVTARAISKPYDFVSRFFAPAIGIDEDPVTGSAHCALAPYWGNILKKREMTGRQLSREGGIVKVTLLNDRVLIGGKVKEVKLSAVFEKALLS